MEKEILKKNIKTMVITHDELEDIGARWLRSHDYRLRVPNCSVVLQDFQTIGVSRPDIIGFNSGESVMIEVKVCRKDFTNDKKKRIRAYEDLEVGEYCYYLAPEGLIETSEVPEEWGLLLYDGKEIKVAKKAHMRLKYNHEGERTMLVSLLRRNNIKGNTIKRSKR